ncbi:programmed cell death protein 5 [Exophiala aquamarina CBS 119918]|uniref:Programmed cell death protein 5 n=1 Tax=Exophiala aquamarina CBS 119918 TaxID=1182545 RepID=A0A072P9N8_9EURO|nr:programmed cell death protein 5 [Exophiala aquamarina CBS 119918]KEF56799.1 programmed cell death protein 5 [Exophiala aquamarina CBS 119918]
MADDELAQIRAARLAQLKQQGGGRSGQTADGGNEDEQRKQESEARSSILNQILEPEAQDRLGRIRLVKESRATDVENRLITLARSGQLRQKVTEDQLKDMLASLSEHEKQSGQTLESVKVVRRGGWDDDDDLDDLLKDS